jgi:CheY-like chemotaxis protein
MPVMDGLQAALKITEMGVETPIIAVTANIMSHDMEYYKSCGMKETLGKPFSAIDLWKCLLRYLEPASQATVVAEHHADDDDAAFLQKMKLEFAKYNRNKFSEIIDSINIGDITTAHRLSHSLKSNAAHIHYEGLRAAAADVEGKLKGGENLVSKEQLDVLEAEIKSVLEELAPLLSEYEAMINVKITDKVRIHEIFDKLEPFLVSKNPECEDMLDDLYRIKGAERLAAKVENFIFDQALEELEILRYEIV